MDQETQKIIAAHLRKPEGETGMEVAYYMNEGNAGMNRFAISKLTPETNHKVLEIGMGNGYFAKEVLEKIPFGFYTGFDYSATMVRAAEELNKDKVGEGRMRFLEGKAANMPFDDGSFEWVFTSNTIYFWEEPAKELKEIKRVLKPGGTLLLAMRPEETMNNIPLTKYGFHIRTKETVHNMLQMGGFTEIKTEEFSEEKEDANGSPAQLKTMVFNCKA